MIQGILILLTFIVVAALMMAKKLPTLVALPLMAVVIGLIAGVPLIAKDDQGVATGLLDGVFEGGTVKMASAIIAVIFGAWLGQLMNRTGVTETIIKKSAELGGGRPLVVTLIMAVATALLFTTLSGLGSIIMVGSIVLPILISVGIPAASAACVFLMSFTTGLALNVANWQVFAKLFSLDIAVVQGFEFYLAAATGVATVVFILVEFARNGIKFAFSAPAPSPAGPSSDTRALKGVTGALAMLTPLIPIVLVAALKLPVTVAFTIGIAWCLVFTARGFSRAMNTLAKTCYDGITDAGPAVSLMVSRWAYILFFIVLAPLALYRGPMNMFGLGSGIAALITGLGTMNPLAVMAAFLSAERIQAGADPTNTQNVWTANFCEVDVNTCTKRILPYLWAVSAIGVLLGAFLYF